MAGLFLEAFKFGSTINVMCTLWIYVIYEYASVFMDLFVCAGLGVQVSYRPMSTLKRFPAGLYPTSQASS